MIETENVLRCSECGASIQPNQVRCDYCGYYFKIESVTTPEQITFELNESESSYSSPIEMGTIDILVAFILAMIAAVVGINLIPSIASLFHP